MFVYSFRDINDVNLNCLYDNLLNCDFRDVLSGDDVDKSVELLTDTFNSTYNICCPIKFKTISPKSKLKPWITKSIMINIKRRDAYLLLYRQGKIPVIFIGVLKTSSLLRYVTLKRPSSRINLIYIGKIFVKHGLSLIV